MKRLFSMSICLLVMCLILCCCSDEQNLTMDSKNTNFATSEAYKGFEYSVVNESITIIKYSKDETNVMVPEKIEDKIVKSIGAEAFYNNKNTVSISLPDTIHKIENNAFYRCYSLKEFYIPKSIESIGETPFFRCSSLEKIIVNEDNLYFESLDGVLYNKGKTKIIEYPEGKKDEIFEIPNSVTTIDGVVFGYHCKHLKKIIIPSSVVNFPDYNIFVYPEEITLVAEKDSKAWEYAQKHGLKVLAQ